MTMNAPAYKAPEGFYQKFGFDKTGNLMADGKALNGIRFDPSSIKLPEQRGNSQNGIASILGFNKPKAPENPFMNGGDVQRLSVDNTGNVYAHLKAPTQSNTPALGMGNRQEYVNPYLSAPQDIKVKLDGIAMDPDRTSKNTGELGASNNAYLRQDREGLYFAQIDQGGNTAAYAYSKYQAPSLPDDSGLQDRKSRKNGGNATRGGVSNASPMLTLLGN